MSVSVEISELDADLWDAFKCGGEWVAANEYRKLVAENAKLREDLEFANNGWEKDSIEFLNLQSENAKLRELCADMLVYIAYPYVCVRPEVLVERARELGIEVDG